MQEFNTVWAVYRENAYDNRDDLLLFYCQTKEIAENFINSRYDDIKYQYERYNYYIDEIEVLNEEETMSFIG